MKRKKLKMDKKIVVIATGGTGGHIFPAIALANDLDGHIEPLFVGVGLGSNRFLKGLEARKIEVKGSSFSLRNLFKWTLFSTIGCIESMRVYRKEKVSCVVGFGSFYSFPSLLAAWILRIPYLIYEPNRVTGRVNRLFSPHAQMNCVLFTDVDYGIKGRKRLVDITKKKLTKTREEILGSLRFLNEKRTLFVMGGSLGSTFLNKRVSCMPIDAHKYQVIHLVGRESEKDEVSGNYRNRGVNAYVASFSDHARAYWSVTDLFIGSSGAGALYESVEFEVAALWVPLSYAKDAHQKANALYAEKKIGSGIMYEESAFDSDQVYRDIDHLFESGKLDHYRKRIAEYKKEHKREKFSDIVGEYV